MLDGLSEDRPTADQHARHADDTEASDGLPDAPPHRRCGQRNGKDAHGFRPRESVLVMQRHHAHSFGYFR